MLCLASDTARMADAAPCRLCGLHKGQRMKNEKLCCTKTKNQVSAGGLEDAATTPFKGYRTRAANYTRKEYGKKGQGWSGTRSGVREHVRVCVCHNVDTFMRACERALIITTATTRKHEKAVVVLGDLGWLCEVV